MYLVRVNPEFPIPLEGDRAGLFERFWNLEVLCPVTEQRTSSVARVTLPRSDASGVPAPETAYLKRYWFPSFNDRIKGFFRNSFFRSSRARREYDNLLLLKSCGAGRVRPIAYGEERTFRLLRRAFIVSEEIPGTVDLKELTESTDNAAMPLEQRRIIAARLGVWTRGLHDIGFRDKGFVPRNILVHRDGERIAFSKIDSPKGKGGRSRPGTGRPAPADLSDLDREAGPIVSRHDKLRFVLAYLASPRVDSEVRAFISRVKEKQGSACR